MTTTPQQLVIDDRRMILDFTALTTAVDVQGIETPDVLVEMFTGLDPELAGLIVVMARDLVRTACRVQELEEILNGRLLS
jgi:hypothetical protein